MKILMTTDTVGGVWNYSLELCKELKKQDVEVHLVAMGAWPSKYQRKEISAFGNVTLYKSDFKMEWMQDPWEDVEKSRKWINCIYHTIKPDLIHLNNYAQVEEEWDCPVVTVFHSCVKTWWQAVKGTSAPAVWDSYAKIVERSLNASDVIVGPTEAILRDAMEAHKIDSETKVIYSGKDMDFQEGINKEEFILCTGRIWDEGKNLNLLSEIAANLDWPVYVAGNNINPNTGRVCEVKNVQFLGKLQPEELKTWMQRAEIFVSPTKYEPFGLAILEAAKAGCALALSNISTLKELWSGNAVFFDPKNPEEAKQIINQLIEDKDFRREVAAKSTAEAEKYNAEKMGSEYYDLYQDLIIKKKKENQQLSKSL